ncbi:MAG: hypothetical protein H6540_04570 [Bacteroidales bacterium]|nr:hypothetical protein [Bacteroidales bacterium]MCB9012409.1 hypothetical protein [Bacteroidales bacterium]
MNDINMNTNDELKGLIERIASNPNGFDHLRIFLKRDERTDWFENSDYLMVTPTSMGKVRLIDIDVEENLIILTVLDCKTDLTGNVRIDINNIHPQTFFIRWQDVRQMVLDETTTRFDNDELLEFDFENAENQV